MKFSIECSAEIDYTRRYETLRTTKLIRKIRLNHRLLHRRGQGKKKSYQLETEIKIIYFDYFLLCQVPPARRVGN